ncbi:hypothetical protein [Streptomyces sp. NPDC006739]|uniref:hypothetical protein n=1 Tax=Streptomyces sp. NPDC006739 TaxID=3364763 RepID=UPI0036B21DE3
MLYVWGDDDQSDDPEQNFLNSLFDGKRGIPSDPAHAEYIPKSDADDSVVPVERFCVGLQGVRGRACTPMSGFHLYPTCGTSDDYAYSRHFADERQGKVLAFTVEWGKSFQPPWAEMAEIVLDVDAGLVQFCRTVA